MDSHYCFYINNKNVIIFYHKTKCIYIFNKTHDSFNKCFLIHSNQNILYFKKLTATRKTVPMRRTGQKVNNCSFFEFKYNSNYRLWISNDIASKYFYYIFLSILPLWQISQSHSKYAAWKPEHFLKHQKNKRKSDYTFYSLGKLKSELRLVNTKNPITRYLYILYRHYFFKLKLKKMVSK